MRYDLTKQQAHGSRNFVAMSAQPGLDALTREPSEGEYAVLSFGDILRALWQRLWIIVLCAVALMVVAIGSSLSQAPKYEASTTLLVGQALEGDVPSSNLSGTQIEGLQSLTKTMATAVSTHRIAEAVIQDLDLSIAPEDFLKNLRAEQIPETQFIEVTYRDPSPERVQKITSTIADEFSRQVSKISPSASAVTATVWERATVTDYPVSPKPLRNGLLGLALGAMLGVIVVFLLENIDDNWRSAEQVEQVSGAPTVGLIPTFTVATSKTKKVGLDGEIPVEAPSTERVHE
jgi:capsular polysaccharide biosynthesis protein